MYWGIAFLTFHSIVKLTWHNKVILAELRKPAFSKNIINCNVNAASPCLLAVYDDLSIEAN